MKKNILIAYPEMMIGGSTTSLLSVLQLLDYEKYDVDLLLDFNQGDLVEAIPAQVNLLPHSRKANSLKQEKIKNYFRPKFILGKLRSKIISKKTGIPIRGEQYISWKDLWQYRKVEKHYDAAISFLEGKQMKFVARHIDADKKIAWIHINYTDAKLDPRYDRDTMCNFDKIVLVSKDCKKAFDDNFPELKERTCIIENILSSNFVQSRGNETIDLKVDKNKINLVTSCRISFASKGLDRAVNALAKLKNEGILQNLSWYVIGDGSDMIKFKNMIYENSLEDIIFPIGSKTNPYPYLKNMSVFFLPSVWEGKPMAVTEGFMMGLPALVTEYSSAREQVRHNVDGYIMENSEDGIYEGLKYILTHKDEVSNWGKNVSETEYSNIEAIRQIELMIDS